MAAACLTAGCAQQWAKPGATETDFRIAQSQCEARAFQAFPRELVTHQPARQPSQQIIIQNDSPSTIRTSCTGFGNTVDCVQRRETNRSSSLYRSELPPRAPLILDYNDGPRARAVDACLLEQGWRPVDSKGNPASPGSGPSAGEVARVLLLGY
ncbi:MAG: hypothetical protein INF88_17645 [Roseomonas sp.]|nr:hypothetical protein [Roseomonas sp.]